MIREQQGVYLRSKPTTWGDGETHEIPLDFLHPTRRWKAPVIRELVFHLRFTDVTGVTATILAEDAYKAFSRIKIRDGGGPIFDLPGSLVRIVEQMEVGSRHRPANGGTVVTSGGTSAEYNIFARVVWSPPKSKRAADFHVPVPAITEGGEIAVTFGTPPGGTFASGTLRVYADCIDEREREAKSRMVWKERAITAQEDDYGVSGLLRAAFASSALTTAGYTALAFSTYASTDSRTLGYADLDNMLLIDRYRKNSPDRDADDEFTIEGGADEETTNAIPLMTPYEGQKMNGMMDLDTVHVDLNGAAPSSGRLVTCAITNRVPDQTSRWMGFSDTASYVAALRDRGFINTGKGQKVVKGGNDARHVKFWDPSLVRKMPLKVRTF